MLSVVVGWRKGMTSLAYTYVLELAGEEMWFGHLGKGGAHWEPGTISPMRHGQIAGDLNDHMSTGAALEAERIASKAAGQLGMAAGQVFLDKFMEEIKANFERYESDGRVALSESKRTWTTTRSEFGVKLELVDKLPRGGPPAVAGMGPFIKGSQDGKDCYVAIAPDSPTSVVELFAALR